MSKMLKTVNLDIDVGIAVEKWIREKKSNNFSRATNNYWRAFFAEDLPGINTKDEKVLLEEYETLVSNAAKIKAKLDEYEHASKVREKSREGTIVFTDEDFKK